MGLLWSELTLSWDHKMLRIIFLKNHQQSWKWFFYIFFNEHINLFHCVTIFPVSFSEDFQTIWHFSCKTNGRFSKRSPLQNHLPTLGKCLAQQIGVPGCHLSHIHIHNNVLSVVGFLKAIGPIGIFGETENRKEKELGGWGNAWHSSSVSQGVSFHSRVNRPRLLPMTTKHNAAMLMFMKKNKTIGISLGAVHK